MSRAAARQSLVAVAVEHGDALEALRGQFPGDAGQHPPPQPRPHDQAAQRIAVAPAKAVGDGRQQADRGAVQLRCGSLQIVIALAQRDQHGQIARQSGHFGPGQVGVGDDVGVESGEWGVGHGEWGVGWPKASVIDH
ncbi:MAG: hypothetical protein V9H69_11350 [Anaerolineae bacterium]